MARTKTVAHRNMGPGVIWDNTLKQYKVNVAKDQPIKINDKGELEVVLSNKSDNQLRVFDGALYYGLQAKPSLANLYVDAVNGVDQDPEKVEGAGTRAKPLRTLTYAASLKEPYSTTTIFLRENQEHLVTTDNVAHLKAGKTYLPVYGSLLDSKLATGTHDYNSGVFELATNGQEPKLVLQGVRLETYLNTSVAHAICINLQKDAAVEINGISLINDLSFTVEKVNNFPQA